MRFQVWWLTGSYDEVHSKIYLVRDAHCNTKVSTIPKSLGQRGFLMNPRISEKAKDLGINEDAEV